MQTNFTLAQLADSGVAESEKILRKCVHCGFCTATCPTYQLLGDELDSPRGRIYLIKDMLENGRAATKKTVKHIDRCLSCLSCMTTCPADVHYMHLVDHARAHIEHTYKRPAMDRFIRWTLSQVLPRPGLFRLALLGAQLARPFKTLLPRAFWSMLDMAPRGQIAPPSPMDLPQVFPAQGERRMRIALMNGCAQKVLDPNINEATIRLLTRHGVEVVVAAGAGCCGALTHHMGKEENAFAAARRNIAAWMLEVRGEGLDHIVVNTSGCGTTLKDYGFMLRNDAAAADAAQIAAISADISEVMMAIGLKPSGQVPHMRVAYHSACSLQHGQKIKTPPKALLEAAGFEVVEPSEPHLCCGSAGTYNLLQPEIAEQLKARKVRNLEATEPQLIAAGNIGCMMQIGSAVGVPVVHTAELLDWATGGPVPTALTSGDKKTLDSSVCSPPKNANPTGERDPAA